MRSRYVYLFLDLSCTCLMWGDTNCTSDVWFSGNKWSENCNYIQTDGFSSKRKPLQDVSRNDCERKKSVVLVISAWCQSDLRDGRWQFCWRRDQELQVERLFLEFDHRHAQPHLQSLRALWTVDHLAARLSLGIPTTVHSAQTQTVQNADCSGAAGTRQRGSRSGRHVPFDAQEFSGHNGPVVWPQSAFRCLTCRNIRTFQLSRHSLLLQCLLVPHVTFVQTHENFGHFSSVHGWKIVVADWTETWVHRNRDEPQKEFSFLHQGRE